MPRRGNTTQRGYGARHQAIRRAWLPRVATGTVNCARCHKPITPTEPWDLGHDDHNRTIYTGPEHRACNRATQAKDRRRDPPGRGTTNW